MAPSAAIRPRLPSGPTRSSPARTLSPWNYWTAKYILYPYDNNDRHHPDFAGINAWLSAARTTIIGRGGLANAARGIVVDEPTMTESDMRLYSGVPSGG